MALLLLLALLPLALPWWISLLRRPLLPLVAVAAQAGFARWTSSGSDCRLQWATWGGGGGCHAQGHSISRPSMARFVDYVVAISFHPVLRALLHSFRVSSPSRAVCPPSWALTVFLRHLPSSSFASLHSTTLRLLVKMVLFFVPLATAFPIDELQALSRCFSFICGDACLSFVLTFVAMCESLLVPSLAPSWFYRCPTLRLVSTYVLCFAQFVPSTFS